MPNKKPTTDTPNSREAIASLLEVDEDMKESVIKVSDAVLKVQDFLAETVKGLDGTEIGAVFLLLRKRIAEVFEECNIDISVFEQGS